MELNVESSMISDSELQKLLRQNKESERIDSGSGDVEEMRTTAIDKEWHLKKRNVSQVYIVEKRRA